MVTVAKRSPKSESWDRFSGIQNRLINMRDGQHKDDLLWLSAIYHEAACVVDAAESSLPALMRNVEALAKVLFGPNYEVRD